MVLDVLDRMITQPLHQILGSLLDWPGFVSWIQSLGDGRCSRMHHKKYLSSMSANTLIFGRHDTRASWLAGQNHGSKEIPTHDWGHVFVADVCTSFAVDQQAAARRRTTFWHAW